MIETDKKVLKTLLFYFSFLTVAGIIVEIIIKNTLFNYTISYVIGTITSLISFLITSFSVNLAIKKEKKGSLVLVFSYIFRLIIYGAILYLIYRLFPKYSIFTCFFGFLSIRISILINYSIVEKIKDNKRSIDELKINDTIKKILKDNNILKVKDLINIERITLLEILSEEEIKEISKSLKEYELFLKGELEVIKEDDDSSKY